MGLQSFATFQKLLKLGHYPPRIGFGAKVKAADINRFSNRFRLARDFQGILLDGYSAATVAGYSAFCQVMLTHSALERFLEINALGKKLDVLGPMMTDYHPEIVIQHFSDKDKKNILFSFLHEKVDPGLKIKLHECRYGSGANVAHLSASLRHIFAHGHLCAHTNGIDPGHVNSICTSVLEFLLNFMDAEFTRKVESYYEKVNSK